MDERLAIQERVKALFEAWCDRRCAQALRELLRGYPLISGLTDDWANLRSALESVRALARHELTYDEVDEVEKLILAVRQILARR